MSVNLRTSRAKPRLSTVAGRKTYTEEELQNALDAILSGKLGTRRAAVLYGIPRSTLRNKVYKLAMEQKREANLLNEASVLDALDDDDDDKELSGDDDDKAVPRWKGKRSIRRSIINKNLFDFYIILYEFQMMHWPHRRTCYPYPHRDHHQRLPPYKSFLKTVVQKRKICPLNCSSRTNLRRLLPHHLHRP